MNELPTCGYGVKMRRNTLKLFSMSECKCALNMVTLSKYMFPDVNSVNSLLQLTLN